MNNIYTYGGYVIRKATFILKYLADKNISNQKSWRRDQRWCGYRKFDVEKSVDRDERHQERPEISQGRNESGS